MEGAFELESLDGAGADDVSETSDMHWLSAHSPSSSSSISFDEGNAAAGGDTAEFLFELPFDYRFDPPPVDDRASASEDESRKRPREQTAGATAPARRVPPPAGASHEAAGVTWFVDVPSSLDGANYTRHLDVPISFEIAAHLLSHDDALVRRPRPRFLEGTAEAIHGQVFKDSVTRREKGSDRYEFKGGPQNFATSTVLGVAADGRRVAVRRSYGRVSTSRVGARGGATADAPARSKVHQYALIAISKDGKQEVLQPHLFHIVGMADENAAVASEHVEPVGKSTAGHVGKNAVGDRLGAPSNMAAGAGGAGAGAGAGAGGEGEEGGEEGGHRAGRERSGGARSGGGLLEEGLDVSGLLTLKQPKARAPWVVFENRHGDPVGSIGPSRGGIALTSGSGDFAEWHARAPGEKPFIAGEVVSIGSSGLCRDTVHAKQLGIISRQAIVAGSMPSDPAEAAAGDTIAYAGRVMVRLRGGCAAGDHIVPSGLEDGTATATRERKGLQVVGRALQSCACTASNLSDKQPTAEWEGEEDGALDRGPSSPTAVQLVECTVVAPPNTVADPVRWRQRSALAAAAVAGCTIAMLAYVVVTVTLASHAAGAGCTPLEPPTHMRIAGQCDGTVGSRCVYEACDDGFVMRLASAASARLLAPVSQQRQSGGMIRECLSSGEVYSGSPVVCVRAHCPRVVDNCSSVSGCCINCDGGSDVVVTFPSTTVDADPSFKRSSSGSVGGAATTVALPCPSMHNGLPMRGTLTRRCIASTSSGEGGVWSPVNGSCTRSGCGSVTHALAGYSIALRSGTEAAKQLASVDHTLRFPDAASGKGVMELPCPSNYTGSIRMTCNAGSTEWSNPVGQCAWLHCPSRLHNAGTSTRPVPMTLPSLSVGDTVTVSCCSRFTLGDGCADPADGIGVVTATCNHDGNGGYAFNISGQCTPSASFRLGLTASTPSGKNGTDLMRQLWSQFSSGMAPHLSKSTGGAWTLPADGMLGVLNLRRGSEWGTVATSPAFTSSREGSLNTKSLGVQGSSRAVAAGNVACRELGFAGASVVTNCQAIANLVKANKGVISGSDELLSALCSTSLESVLLEISSRDPHFSSEQSGEWLPPVHSSDNTSLYRGPPPWLVIPSARRRSWCVGDEMDGQHTSRGTDCDLGSGARSGVCTSASAGTAGALARCMQFDLFNHPNGPDPSVVQKRAGRDKSIPRNNYHLVLGCTGWGEAPPSYPIVHGALRRQPGRSGGRGGGTWVVGDGLGSYGHDDVRAPKIFSDTMPHLCLDQQLGRRTTAMGRLEAASSAFYHGDAEVDPDGTLLQFRDDNFTYPGVSTCDRGCVQTMFEAGELRQFSDVDAIPQWWCSLSCRAQAIWASRQPGLP